MLMTSAQPARPISQSYQAFQPMPRCPKSWLKSWSFHPLLCWGEAGSLTPDVAGIRSNCIEPGLQARYLWFGDRWRRRQLFRSNCALTQRDVLTARLASVICPVVTTTATVQRRQGHFRTTLWAENDVILSSMACRLSFPREGSPGPCASHGQDRQCWNRTPRPWFHASETETDRTVAVSVATGQRDEVNRLYMDWSCMWMDCISGPLK